MSDDLRERVRRGEFRAFLDPSLPLHLLAEPDAEWFWIGAERFLLLLNYGAQGHQMPLRGPDPRSVRHLLRAALGIVWIERDADLDTVLALLQACVGQNGDG